MRHTLLVLIALFTIANTALAQLQTSVAEGITLAGNLKKLNKKAKYGAGLIEQQFEFSTGKGIIGTPVVTSVEHGKIEMVAIDDHVTMGHLLDYNQFVQVKDYDFEVFYKSGFKSQKYPPEKISLTGDDIYLDDSYGLFYGFKADASGQRCRFKYEYQYTDAKYLTRLFFHEGMPIKEKKISFKVPNWLVLDIAEKNFGTYTIKKEVKKDKDFTTYTYSANNLIGIKRESASLARPYYLPHLVITVRSYTISQKQYNGFKTVDDLYAWYNYLYKKAENKTDDFKATVNQLTQGKATDEEKIKAIYYWVQDNIRYIAFEEGYSGFVPQTTQEVFKNKFGDCKGMANLVTEMLKLAGYDAHFAWIGTREIPYDHAEVQSMCVDNHAICVLYHKGKTYFVDGTEKYASLGKNAYRIQGKSVLVQNGDGYKLEKVPTPTADENKITTKANLTLDGDKITGHVTLTYAGEGKNFFHNIYNNIPSNKRKEFITKMVELNNANAEATNVKTSDIKNRDIPIVIEGDVEISNQVTVVDNTCYTGIDFFPGSIVGFIPEEDRQTPIDIDAVFAFADEVSLKLPAKAKPTTLPKPLQLSFSNNNISAEYSSANNTITLKKNLQINSPVINPTDFVAWKNFLNKIKEYNRNNVNIQL